MYTLVYKCNNCSCTVPAETIDGRVVPPPELCLACTTITETTTRKRKQVGDVYNGLQLDYYSRPEQTWRVRCLFCKDYTIVKNNNVSKQKSCGCLKASTLIVAYFHTDNQHVRCKCATCSLEMDYDMLKDDEPIICAAGCVGKGQLV